MQTSKLTKKTMVILLSSLLAISLSAGISFAQTDKLVVEDGLSNKVFSVNDAGEVTATFGITTRNNDYTYNNMEPYSDVNWAGGFFGVLRGRGTSAAPATVSLNDVVFTFDAQAYNGTNFARGGQIIGNVDGTPGPGNGTPGSGYVPFRWSFRTTNTAGVLADRMTIKASGNVGIGTTNPTHLIQLAGGAYSDGASWTNASSRELKKNIAEISADEAVKVIENLKPVSFNYKKDDQEQHVGFIAEDVPELVATNDRKGIDSMDIAAVLTKVVQEQQKTMKELQSKIGELETALQFKQDKDAGLVQVEVNQGLQK